MKRIAFYGGSFDPVHLGHLQIARELAEHFELDKFVLIPAFHAPHKSRRKPTSGYHRFAMLCLATQDDSSIEVSTMELEAPEKPYTIETMKMVLADKPAESIYFVMGSDSWAEITTWKDWKKVLEIVNIIVVTRPGYEIGFSHITDEIGQRIVDLRIAKGMKAIKDETAANQIFLTDAVLTDISSTEIRHAVRDNKKGWEKLVSKETEEYIRKYKLYL